MSNSKNKILILTTAIVVILIVVLIIAFKPGTNKLPAQVTINRDNQPTIGNRNAKIHMVVFEDLKCGNCKIYNNTLFPKIKQKYIDSGKASYTVINLAFIEGSMSAANAARCLYRQKSDYFFSFLDYVYHNQPPENENWATISQLLQFAKQSTPKANLSELGNCIIEGRYNNVIQGNLKQAIKVMNGQVGTPTLYVNGYVVTPLTMERLDAIINKIS